jgi:hypothetical protein
MSKQVFWPAALVVFGLILLASNLGLLPRDFFNLWPLMLVIVGLGGLVTSDRIEWIIPEKKATKSSTKTKKAPARRKK